MAHKHNAGWKFMHIRNQIRLVACPVCKAIPGQHCIKKNGGTRYASHQPRWDAYREQYGV